jgi:hypothetical protein
VTDTPNAPTPTTPATAEQLREDAIVVRRCAAFNRETGLAQLHHELLERAAAALDAEAARMEAQHAELRGWGVMRPDGTLMEHYREYEEQIRVVLEPYPSYRAVPVRLTTEGAE